MQKSERYDLNDLQSDMGHLKHLIDTIVDTLVEDCEFGPPDNRAPGLDRLNGLLWIARDHVHSLDDRVDTHYEEIGTTSARNVQNAA